MQLLNGISLDIKLNVWKKLADLLMRIVGNCEVDASFFHPRRNCTSLLTLNRRKSWYQDWWVMRTKIAETHWLNQSSWMLLLWLLALVENHLRMMKNSLKVWMNSQTHQFNCLDLCSSSWWWSQLWSSWWICWLERRITGEGLNLILRNGLKYANWNWFLSIYFSNKSSFLHYYSFIK